MEKTKSGVDKFVLWETVVKANREILKEISCTEDSKMQEALKERRVRKLKEIQQYVLAKISYVTRDAA